MSSRKGDTLRAEAEATLKKTSFSIFGFGGGGTKKYEDAAELFTKAGNAYKLDSNWQPAGECFRRASECLTSSDNETDAVNSLVEAGNCFKNVDQTEAVQCFLSAIDKYNDKGRFGQSAKMHKDIAEMYESGHNNEQAVAHYREAAKLFSNDNKKTSASPCLLKIAAITSSEDKFTEAASIYESLGNECMESRLGAYSAKGHYLNCVLCHLAAGDTVAAHQKIDSFKDRDHNFPSSRECGFVEKLLLNMESNNAEGFADACAEFDNITPLDKWKVSICLKAKRHIMSGDGEGEENIC